MSSQHADRAVVAVRMPEQLRAAANEVLRSHDREMKAYVQACLHELIAEPDDTLQRLEPHWPQPRPRGRPTKPAPTPEA